MKDRKHIIKASIIVLTFIFAISSKAQVPAFTSAEGFGKFATGGRGGQVVFVTTTEDYALFDGHSLNIRKNLSPLFSELQES